MVGDHDGRPLYGEEAANANPYASLENWVYLNGHTDRFETDPLAVLAEWNAAMDAEAQTGRLGPAKAARRAVRGG